MGKAKKIAFICFFILCLSALGLRISKHMVTDITFSSPFAPGETVYYNGVTYITTDDFIEKCKANGVLSQDADGLNPTPYEYHTSNKASKRYAKYVREKNYTKDIVYDTVYDTIYEIIFGASYSFKIDTEDKNSTILYSAHGDLPSYIRSDFVFPTIKKNKVSAVIINEDYENRLTEEKTISDFIDAIYTEGKVTKEIQEYVSLNDNTTIHFMYDNCDCFNELVGEFSKETGELGV